jgi:GNAT superfamily N-acetyltransferase
MRDRVLAAAAMAVRRRCEGVEGAEVLERDGLVLSLTNVPEASRTPYTWSVSRPTPRVRSRGPRRRWAVGVTRSASTTHPDGGRSSTGVRDAGLERLLSRPVMVVEVGSVPDAATPPGVRIEPVERREDALALARVDATAFGGRLEISERAFAPSIVGVEGARGFVAWAGDEAVGCAVAQDGAGATDVFGVGVVSEARRRGIGAALTVAAVRAFPADLAWLMPSDMARPMYERLGFRDLETWEVWVRPRPA